VVVLAGLAALLGGGAFLVTEAMTGGASIVPDVAAMAPAVPSDSPRETAPLAAAPPSWTEPMKPERSAAAVSRLPSPTPAATLSAGTPFSAPGTVAAVDVAGVTNVGSLEVDGATMRVVSAQYDLTGQRELAWAADNGVGVGPYVRCTQNFRFSSDGPVQERPTMLLCWRTSEGKSVIAFAQTRQGRPSRAASVAAIGLQWAKLS
jgi:hypothetical protein